MRLKKVYTLLSIIFLTSVFCASRVSAISMDDCDLLVPEDYTTITLALGSAVNGDIICVAPGVYSENIHFSGEEVVTLVSITDMEDRNMPARTEGEIATIQGFGLTSVVTFDNDSAIHGFYITDGYSLPGGGGISVRSASPTIENCIIDGNQAVWVGGGIYIANNSSPAIKNCVITNNEVFDNNMWSSGGGIQSIDSSPTIENCTIAHNTAYGDGDGDVGAGIYFGGDSTGASIKNSIIYSNDPDSIWPGGIELALFDYNDCEGVCPPGNENIDTDPKFKMVGTCICCHILDPGVLGEPDSPSPCIDAGDPASDNSNEPMDNFCRINMGGYGDTDYAAVSLCDDVDDSDCDGVLNSVDNCPDDANGPDFGTCVTDTNAATAQRCCSDADCDEDHFCSKDQEDTDDDDIGDACDVGDTDGDDIYDDVDNCRYIFNTGQEDRDGDCPDPGDDGYETDPSCGDVCDNCPDNPNQDQEDTDGDGVGNECDNCDETPNGPDLGTCIRVEGYMYVATTRTCVKWDDVNCVQGEFCDMSQFDYDDDEIGDACECPVDFDCDGSVSTGDYSIYISDYGRGQWYNPCAVCETGNSYQWPSTDACSIDGDCDDGNCVATSDVCEGDLDCDGDVGGGDTRIYQLQYGKVNCESCYDGACAYDY